jgi:hypothetical protein
VTLSPEQSSRRAGLFRHYRTGELLEVQFRDNKLYQVTNMELVPIAENRFQVANSQRVLEFYRDANAQRDQLRELFPNGDTALYLPTAAFSPDAGKLAEYAGTYFSPDLEISFTTKVENGRLILYRRPDLNLPLVPIYTDAFRGPVGLIRFHRDASGRITELSIGASRVYDLRATRQ